VPWVHLLICVHPYKCVVSTKQRLKKGIDAGGSCYGYISSSACICVRVWSAQSSVKNNELKLEARAMGTSPHLRAFAYVCGQHKAALEKLSRSWRLVPWVHLLICMHLRKCVVSTKQRFKKGIEAGGSCHGYISSSACICVSVWSAQSSVLKKE